MGNDSRRCRDSEWCETNDPRGTSARSFTSVANIHHETSIDRTPCLVAADFAQPPNFHGDLIVTIRTHRKSRSFSRCRTNRRREGGRSARTQHHETCRQCLQLPDRSRNPFARSTFCHARRVDSYVNSSVYASTVDEPRSRRGPRASSLRDPDASGPPCESAERALSDIRSPGQTDSPGVSQGTDVRLSEKSHFLRKRGVATKVKIPEEKSTFVAIGTNVLSQSAQYHPIRAHRQRRQSTHDRHSILGCHICK